MANPTKITQPRIVRVAPNVSDPLMKNPRGPAEVMLNDELGQDVNMNDVVFDKAQNQNKTKEETTQQSSQDSNNAPSETNMMVVISFALIVIALIAIIVWMVMKNNNANKEQEEDIKQLIQPHPRNGMPAGPHVGPNAGPRAGPPRHMQQMGGHVVNQGAPYYNNFNPNVMPNQNPNVQMHMNQPRTMQTDPNTSMNIHTIRRPLNAMEKMQNVDLNTEDNPRSELLDNTTSTSGKKVTFSDVINSLKTDDTDKQTAKLLDQSGKNETQNANLNKADQASRADQANKDDKLLTTQSNNLDNSKLNVDEVMAQTEAMLNKKNKPPVEMTDVDKALLDRVSKEASLNEPITDYEDLK